MTILESKVAVVTGGAGGIGRIVVRALAARGAKVVVIDRGAGRARDAGGGIGGDAGKGPSMLVADVTMSGQVKRALDEVKQHYGRVDVLVNMAGVQKPIGKLAEVNEADWAECVKTNLIGAMMCCRHVLPFMIEQGKGKIINFSGGGATFPRPCFSAYAASKAGLVRFTETLACEYRESRIDVNAVAPGPVYTGMIEEIIEAGKMAGSDDYEAALKIRERGTSDGEGRIAELTVYLSSDRSDGFTGRLVSALWDDWRHIDSHKEDFVDSSLFTMRRVDGVKIVEEKTE